MPISGNKSSITGKSKLRNYLFFENHKADLHGCKAFKVNYFLDWETIETLVGKLLKLFDAINVFNKDIEEAMSQRRISHQKYEQYTLEESKRSNTLLFELCHQCDRDWTSENSSDSDTTWSGMSEPDRKSLIVHFWKKVFVPPTNLGT